MIHGDINFGIHCLPGLLIDANSVNKPRTLSLYILVQFSNRYGKGFDSEKRDRAGEN